MPTERSGPAPRRAGRRGRRPGTNDTRNAILQAARADFAEKGYDATSLRGIARRAGVDPALLHHYFDGKAGLFAETVAIPLDVRSVVTRIVSGPPETLGERVVRTFLSVWDPPERRDRLVALLLSVASHERAAAVLREFVARELLGRIAEQSPAPNAPMRAAVAASQMIGIAVLRYVLRIEPIASASHDELIALIGPALQEYLAPQQFGPPSGPSPAAR